MNVLNSKVLFSTIALAAFLVGCGGASKTKMGEIENRIKALTDKGTPDSILANVKVFQYNVAAAQKINNSGHARKYTDSMLVAIEIAEKWYEEAMVQNKSYLDTKGADLRNRKAALTGLPLRTADSMFAVVDSLVKMNWLIMARTKLDKLDTAMVTLENDEKKSVEVRKKVVGKWGDAHWVKPEEANYKALDKKVYKFTKDMKFEGDESMKGQTTEFMKEDWQFLSWGDYDIKGDTIFIFVKREKCTRQIFTQWHIKDKKWIEGKKPTYDSTITNGAKDRFILYSDLKSDFKKM
ncbi:MAG: hypothetical protein JW915_02970 [Chitinispirillaceae bacterium]|nr:hypothetical protein [Chitinispirillaceae bacterium]